MAQRHRFSRKQHKNAIHQRRDAPTRAAASSLERKPPTVYGKAFVILEDENKNTFEYAQGAWIPYSMTIAECKQDCQVKELPQKVNGKTRYEIRSPVPTATEIGPIMGILTRRQGDLFVISSDQTAELPATKRAPRHVNDICQVWSGGTWSINVEEAMTFASLDEADEYVRAHYDELSSKIQR